MKFSSRASVPVEGTRRLDPPGSDRVTYPDRANRSRSEVEPASFPGTDPSDIAYNPPIASSARNAGISQAMRIAAAAWHRGTHQSSTSRRSNACGA